LIRVEDAGGSILVERQLENADQPYLLPSGSFAVTISGLMPAAQEFTTDLEPLRSLELANLIGSFSTSVTASRVVIGQHCWGFAPEARVSTRSMELSTIVDNTLLTVSSLGLLKVSGSGAVTVYTPNPNQVVDRGPDLDYGRVWYKLDTVTGLDGNFYSLIETPDHYEVVRWNLSELPSRTIPPPSGAAPVFSLPNEVPAKVGVKLALTVTASTSDGQDPTYSAQGVPSGAIYYPEAATSSVFVWTPTPADVGSHQVTFKAEDHMCKSTTKVVTVNVTE